LMAVIVFLAVAVLTVFVKREGGWM